MFSDTKQKAVKFVKQISSVIGEAQLPLLVLFGQTRFDACTQRSATVEDIMVLLRHNYRTLPYPGCGVTKPTRTTKTVKRFETSFFRRSTQYKMCVAAWKMKMMLLRFKYTVGHVILSSKSSDC